eukprot:CAMPEP_0113323016 /NCGR_PEP_ID=MMETSP0010_2-20120614/15998_1 /TAXON_ID=216773 ORGANISM="Corethron hystrix, Strain 308" /NCGR_SAMPLE_ID=MMETSP0010_2 /ASSEMBLY_ACC=CAM_ASM_000155 /LENGTH=95 /DNA_ID=CAMNT_0000181723 /DNA_START=177 /DNA_END=464 /DNA_ORIENTATION=+ /assembly_acc=CAM_ASM_000155
MDLDRDVSPRRAAESPINITVATQACALRRSSALVRMRKELRSLGTPGPAFRRNGRKASTNVVSKTPPGRRDKTDTIDARCSEERLRDVHRVLFT